MTALTFSSRKTMPTAIGYAGAIVTVLIWANWILATRHTAETQMSTIDLGLIRYGMPALVLSPVWLRTGLLPKGVPLKLLALMVCGSGALFFQLTTFAIHSTPAASAGILLGGSMPLATALIGVLLFRERPDITVGLVSAAIVAGVIILLVRSLSGTEISWVSFTLLPLGALLWAAYTHAFRRSGLNAIQSSAIIAIWSFLIHVASGLRLRQLARLGAATGNRPAGRQPGSAFRPCRHARLRPRRPGPRRHAGGRLHRHHPGSRHLRRRAAARRTDRRCGNCSGSCHGNGRCAFDGSFVEEVSATVSKVKKKAAVGSLPH